VSGLRLLSYNVRYGGAGRVDAIARIIDQCRADVVVLQEATRPDVVEDIAIRAGMAEWRSFRRQSLAFMSREKVAHAEWHRPRLSRHAFIEVVLPGGRGRIFGVHLSAVHAAWTERRRLFEVRALLASIARHERGFHVLVGDFNTLAPGERLDVARLPRRLRPFVWLSGGRIKWRTVQTILDAGYTDAYRTQHALAPGHTFPTWDPHLRLDYVFVPLDHAGRIRSCEVVADARAVEASDHFPIVTDVDV
jgi:exodeoxyribonuclease III